MDANFYYENIKITKAENNGTPVLLAKIAKPKVPVNGTLRSAMIEAAKNISACNAHEPVALLLDYSYESILTLLSFKYAGVSFVPYVLEFTKLRELKNPNDALIRFVKTHTNLDIKSIAFDFSNPEHLDGLEKLRGATDSNNPEELFKIWAAGNIKEPLVLPGRFVSPLHTVNGSPMGWDLPNAADFALYNFLKTFGGVPSFLTSSPEVIEHQTKLLNNRCLRDLYEIQSRQLKLKNSTYRKQIAIEFGFTEVSNYSEPVKFESSYKSAIRLYERDVKEDIACVFNRMRSHKSPLLLVTDMSSDLAPLSDDERSQDTYLKLIEESESLRVTGAALEISKNEKGSCLALFPILGSVHNFRGDLKSIDSFVRTLEYFKNQNNNYSRTDLYKNSEVQELVKFFNESIEFYFKKMGYLYDHFEIVQCWANKAEFGQIHHQHNHPNSMISGVFYVTESTGGATNFSMKTARDLVPQFTDSTPWNDLSVQFLPTPGQLILFPSWMDHYVKSHRDRNKERYTIAFNATIRGELGDLPSGTWLKI